MNDSEFWFLDLSVIIAYTGVVTVLLLAGLGGPVRIILAIPLIIFLPGYAFVSILYPDEHDGRAERTEPEGPKLIDPTSLPQGLNVVERVILSIVFSIAIVPMVAVIVSFTPWGITLWALLIGIGTTTIAFSLLGIATRWRCPPDQRVTLTDYRLSMLLRSGHGPLDRTPTNHYNTALVLSFLLLATTVGYAAVAAPQHDGFTEVYVETEEITGDTDIMYESSYTVGEPQPFTVFIGNHENRDNTYTVFVLLQQVSYGDEGVDVTDEDELTRTEVHVANGETRAVNLEISPTMTGNDLRLLVLVYVESPPGEPDADTADHILRLPIEVT